MSVNQTKLAILKIILDHLNTKVKLNLDEDKRTILQYYNEDLYNDFSKALIDTPITFNELLNQYTEYDYFVLNLVLDVIDKVRLTRDTVTKITIDILNGVFSDDKIQELQKKLKILLNGDGENSIDAEFKKRALESVQSSRHTPHPTPSRLSRLYGVMPWTKKGGRKRKSKKRKSRKLRKRRKSKKRKHKSRKHKHR